ncbi:50S ribosomal protein L7ae [Candidatus Woesearchaeota archaeon]|nr:50S ribosomal protein L7ae [Candidatus Woesearchaeota archaeon]
MEDVKEKVYQAIEIAKSTGKIKKGTNEVTKVVDKGTAKLVAVANDVSPKELVMHIPIICKEKEVMCFEVGSKDELGAAAGLPVGSAAIAITKEGDAKDILKELSKESK